MTIVTDPDNLDRFTIAVDPVSELISIRGLGAERTQILNTGSGDGTTTFRDSTNGNFVSSGVVAGDVLTIVGDPSNNSGVIGHYEVTSSITATTFVIDRAIASGASADLGYKISASQATGISTESVSDGVTLQAIYSFLKEEWRTLGTGIGNAPDLIKFTFPLESITREQFEIGGPTHTDWNWASTNGDQDPKNLVRTGGWARLDGNNVVQQHYAGIITLGTLDGDAQVYYLQESSTTGIPTDFVLPGTVNQAILTLEKVPGSTEANSNNATHFDFNDSDPDTIDRQIGDFITDGFASGNVVQVVNATNTSNNGFFLIDSVTTGTLTLNTSASLTSSLTDTAARLTSMNDNRSSLKLFVRKKARSYVDSEISDIGVTEIEPIVNRFPLTHTSDPAITLDDGAMHGDGTNVNFQATVNAATDTNGSVRDADTTDGGFEFTAAAQTFNAGGGGSQIYPGDTLEITTAGDALGVYEVSGVTSATGLSLIEEPGRVITNLDSLSWTARTRVRHEDFGDGQTTDSATAGQGLFTSATGLFSTRGVVAGDMLVIKNGTSAVQGVYKVISIPSETGVEVNTANVADSGTSLRGDQDNWPDESSLSFEVLRRGMHLQFKNENATPKGPSASSGYSIDNTDNLIIILDDLENSWRTDGYTVGGEITVANAEEVANNATYLVTGVLTTTFTDDTLGIATQAIGDPTLTTNAQDTTVTFTGKNGFIRPLNSVQHSFVWRLYGNDGTLAECFQFLQRELRKGHTGHSDTDIDESLSLSRGDITDALMTFTTPNGTTINLFIDDLDSTEFNNVTKQDQLTQNRNFAFIAGITINLNTNLITSSTNKIVVFFTDPNAVTDGNEFGTQGAIVVQQDDNSQMQALDQTTSPLSFTFDYDNNNQGGRNTAESQTPITIVAIATDTAQYTQVAGNILRQSSNVFSVTAGLERNYQNV